MVPVYPTRQQYRLMPLQGLTLEGYGVVGKAEEIAEREHLGNVRRDGHDEIDHSIAVAAMAKEARLSASGQALAWVHDVCEDSKKALTPAGVGQEFGRKYCRKITPNLDAVTRREGETDEEYYGRIEAVAKDDPEVAFVKGFDKKHFHLCPYGRPEDEEKNRGRRIEKCHETLIPFRQMTQRIRPFVPEDRLQEYDELMGEVFSLAQTQLDELESCAA